MELERRRPWWMIGQHITREHFFIMLVLAVALHLSGMIWWYRWFDTETVDVPVRVINLRLGSGGEIFARSPQSPEGGEPSAAPAAAAEPARPVAETPPARLTPRAEAAEAKAPDQTEPSETGIASAETPAPDISAEQLQAMVAQPAAEAAQAMAAETAAAAKDAHYTRTAGSRLGEDERIRAQIMARYEQQLSAWIQKHKRYPQYAQKHGITGRGIVRIRINRKGQILFSKLEMATGSKLLDQAVMDMIRRSDPVPPVPNAYSGGEQFEFQIPVIFK